MNAMSGLEPMQLQQEREEFSLINVFHGNDNLLKTDNLSLYNSIYYVIQCKCKLIIPLLYINHINLSASNHSHRMVSITI